MEAGFAVSRHLLDAEIGNMLGAKPGAPSDGSIAASTTGTPAPLANMVAPITSKNAYTIMHDMKDV
jgi:hypothetical protein